MLRWHNGIGWTNSLSGDDAAKLGAEQFFNTPSPPPARALGDTGVHRPQSVEALPAITSTVVITLIFGLFGLIPTFINTDRARMIGRPTNRYWKAFWWSFAVEIAVWVFIWIIAAAIAASSVSSSY